MEDSQSQSGAGYGCIELEIESLDSWSVVILNMERRTSQSTMGMYVGAETDVREMVQSHARLRSLLQRSGYTQR